MLFKHHIDLLKHLKGGNSLEDFLEQHRGLERLNIMRSIKEQYPLKPSSEIKDSIKDNFNYNVTVQDLVLGQFIMVEQIITGKTKLPDYEVDLEILKLILRPKHHDIFDNDSEEDELRNEEKILNTETLDLYAVLNVFIENRNKVLFNDFAGVFYDARDDEDEDEDQEYKNNSTAENIFQNQWYWYSIVRLLAQEDITRYNEIYLLPMNVVLPEMSYLAQKNKIEEANRRQQEAMRKL